MAQGADALFLNDREVKYPGPNSFTWVPGTPVVVDGAAGYIPPSSGRGASVTGNPWQETGDSSDG